MTYSQPPASRPAVVLLRPLLETVYPAETDAALIVLTLRHVSFRQACHDPESTPIAQSQRRSATLAVSA